MPTESNLIVAAEHNILLHRGDTPQCILEFYDQNNVPLPLTTQTPLMQCRWNKGDADYVKQWTVGNGLAISGADNNILTITGFETLRPGRFAYDLQLTSSAGDKTTYMKGQIIVEEDTTR